MKLLYSNVPLELPSSSRAKQTLDFFNNFFNTNIEIDNPTVINVQSFFEKRGFSKVSAESIAIILVTQGKKDDVNPAQLIDTLTGLDSVQISSLVAEILNYNRYKSSILGYKIGIDSAAEQARNIIP